MPINADALDHELINIKRYFRSMPRFWSELVGIDWDRAMIKGVLVMVLEDESWITSICDVK